MEKLTVRGRVLTNQYSPHGSVSGLVIPDPRYPDINWTDMAPSLWVSGILALGSEVEVTVKVR